MSVPCGRLISVGDFCVMLALEILICAQQTAVSRASQALNSPHINHPQGRGVIQNPLAGGIPCNPWFSPKGAKNNRSDRKNRRVFLREDFFGGVECSEGAEMRKAPPLKLV